MNRHKFLKAMSAAAAVAILPFDLLWARLCPRVGVTAETEVDGKWIPIIARDGLQAGMTIRCASFIPGRYHLGIVEKLPETYYANNVRGERVVLQEGVSGYQAISEDRGTLIALEYHEGIEGSHFGPEWVCGSISNSKGIEKLQLSV